MATGYCAKDYHCTPTGVEFQTEEPWLQELYDRCERYCVENEAVFQDKRVLREGSEYDGVWLETQPMGGEMYAKRNMEVALNNQLIFMENQRRDGRFPGTIRFGKARLLEVCYGWLQGYCFPVPALKMYYLIGKDPGYLERLYTALRDFDNYLWSCRDSDGDGCLETWCVWDTGEDNCSRFLRLGAADGGWGGEDPPTGVGKLPYESMDLMSYSCQGREVLAEVSRLLGNGEEALWRQRARQVREKLRDYLWDGKKHACFDRDCDNKPMDILLHNNLRCMYFGSFTPQMADEFMRFHLLNPEEFWTELPLPSIAVNDPYFRCDRWNDWSGPVMGLTYQRAIQALENYGYEAELRLLGKKWIGNLKRHPQLIQQYSPFDGSPATFHLEELRAQQRNDTIGQDGYGPTVLSTLEYISLLCGVNVAFDRVQWSAVQGGSPTTYTQTMLGRRYTLVQDGERMRAFVDGKELFCCDCGVQVKTDLDGTLLELTGIEETEREVRLETAGEERRCRLGRNRRVVYNR